MAAEVYVHPGVTIGADADRRSRGAVLHDALRQIVGGNPAAPPGCGRLEHVESVEGVETVFIARGSAGEVRSMSCIAPKTKVICSDRQLDDALVLVVHVAPLCWGMIKHLQKQKTKTGNSTPP